jgi:hypothetical protein
MTETMIAYANRVGDALAPYALSPAILSIALVLAAFWMLVVIAILQD